MTDEPMIEAEVWSHARYFAARNLAAGVVMTPAERRVAEALVSGDAVEPSELLMFMRANKAHVRQGALDTAAMLRALPVDLDETGLRIYEDDLLEIAASYDTSRE